jgi:mRNA interferase HigB
MRVAGKGKLVLFKVAYTDARSQIDAWLAEAEEAQWRAPQDIKQRYAHASFLRDNRVIFNIRGNNYRLDTQN